MTARIRGKSQPRTKPSEERRAELMDAAMTLFIEKGVAPTTIEQITEGARVAKGTFYLHFNSKEDVLAALRERFVRELLQGIERSVAEQPADDWPGKLGAWARASIGGYFEALPLHDVVFHELKAHSRDEHSDNPLVEHLCALLDAGAAAGAWHAEDPRFIAVFLFHGYHGIVDDALVKEKRVNKARLAKKLTAQFFQAVGLPLAP
jgi:AcrR family transcriptional regulator